MLLATSYNIFYHIGFLGHIVPAIPLYVYGLLMILEHMRIVQTPPIKGAIWAIICGGLYALMELTMLVSAQNNHETMDAITHMNVGMLIASGGVFDYIIQEKDSVLFGVPFAFGLVSVPLGFHHHIHKDGTDDTQSDVFHMWFALSMLITGVLHAVAIKWHRWTLLCGMSVLLSACILTCLSPFILQPIEQSPVGINNLLSFCFYGAMIPVMIAVTYNNRRSDNTSI